MSELNGPLNGPLVYVTRSDKTSLNARKYTHPYNGTYLLLCMCYSNSVSFIELLTLGKMWHVIL